MHLNILKFSLLCDPKRNMTTGNKLQHEVNLFKPRQITAELTSAQALRKDTLIKKMETALVYEVFFIFVCLTANQEFKTAKREKTYISCFILTALICLSIGKYLPKYLIHTLLNLYLKYLST